MWRLCVLVVRSGCAWWLCVVTVRGGYVVLLCVVAVLVGCDWWLCVVAMWCGCAWWLCVVVVRGGCAWWSCGCAVLSYPIAPETAAPLSSTTFDRTTIRTTNHTPHALPPHAKPNVQPPLSLHTRHSRHATAPIAALSLPGPRPSSLPRAPPPVASLPPAPVGSKHHSIHIEYSIENMCHFSLEPNH